MKNKLLVLGAGLLSVMCLGGCDGAGSNNRTRAITISETFNATGDDMRYTALLNVCVNNWGKDANQYYKGYTFSNILGCSFTYTYKSYVYGSDSSPVIVYHELSIHSSWDDAYTKPSYIDSFVTLGNYTFYGDFNFVIQRK